MLRRAFCPHTEKHVSSARNIEWRRAACTTAERLVRADERVPHHGATRNGVATLSSGGAGRSRRNKAGLRDDDVDADVWARASERVRHVRGRSSASFLGVAPPSGFQSSARTFRSLDLAALAISSGFSLKASPARTRAPSSATLLVGGSHLLPPSLFVVLSPSLCHSYFFAFSFSLSLFVSLSSSSVASSSSSSSRFPPAFLHSAYLHCQPAARAQLSAKR